MKKRKKSISSRQNRDESILNLLQEGDLKIEDIKILLQEKIENCNKKIRFYDGRKHLESIDLNKLKNKYTDIITDQDIFNQLLKIDRKQNKSFVLTYFYMPNAMELRFIIRQEYTYTRRLNNELVSTKEWIPLVVVIDKSAKLIQIRIGTKKSVPYDDIFNHCEDWIKNLLELSEEDQLNIYEIKDTINYLFNQNILVKYEGTHCVKQYNSKKYVCTADLKITIKDEDKKGKIDYVNLELYKNLKTTDNTVQKIRGIWNDTEVKVFIKSDRKIYYDAMKNEIMTYADYTEKEMNYALSFLGRDRTTTR